MKQLVVILALFGLTVQAQAQKIKVRKVKGNQAIVQFTQAAPLVTGGVYELSSSDEFDDVHTGRDRLVGLDLSFKTLNVESDSGNASKTVFTMNAKFGWNLGNFEVGPKIQFESADDAGAKTSLLAAGGFGDFNMIPNAEGETFTYGVGAQLAFGTRTSSSVDYNLLDGKLGPFAKWFPYGGTFAIRGDLLYGYQTQSSSDFDITESGLIFTAGITNYF